MARSISKLPTIRPSRHDMCEASRTTSLSSDKATPSEREHGCYEMFAGRSCASLFLKMLTNKYELIYVQKPMATAGIP